MSERTVETRDGLTLALHEWTPERERLCTLLVHGYGEHCGRYSELARHFNAHGISLLGIDFRGHGMSEGRRGYIERFTDYHLDLDALLEHALASRPEPRIALLAHSMGCLVVADWLLARDPRSIARRLAFSSPYLGLPSNLGPFPRALVTGLSRFVPWFPIPTPLRAENLCRDASRQEAYRRDPLNFHHTNVRWVAQSLVATDRVMDGAGALRHQFLVLHGDADVIVSKDAIGSFCRRLGRLAHCETLPGYRHEILNEPEPDRRAVMDRFVDWLLDGTIPEAGG